MMEAVEKAGIFNGYLEDLVYTQSSSRLEERIRKAHLAGSSGPNPAKHIPARTANGSGILSRPVAVVSLTWAAIAWRSPAALLAKILNLLK